MRPRDGDAPRPGRARGAEHYYDRAARSLARTDAEPAPEPAPASAVIAVLNRLRAGHPLGARDVVALLVVADRIGSLHDGRCIASLPVLAATAGLSRSSMQRALADLVASGWLMRQRRGRDLTDLVRLGPEAVKTSQRATSQRATSQPARMRSQGATAERSQAETQSSPLSSPEALHPIPTLPPRGKELGALVDAAARHSLAGGIPAYRDTRRRFKDWFAAGLALEEVKARIDRREHVKRCRL